ncbi:IS1634 family transposase [Saccharopolyspora spinosa]|uniref:IS1634 family transposase n=1 Tax=Saccharopolyspora spinosa TaxID=60894 RepID=UPI003B43C5CC
MEQRRQQKKANNAKRYQARRAAADRVAELEKLKGHAAAAAGAVSGSPGEQGPLTEEQAAELAALQPKAQRRQERKAKNAKYHQARKAEADRVVELEELAGRGPLTAISLTGHTPAEFRLAWRTDQKARKRLENRFFGKRVLFTNRTEWTVAEVVAAYRSQSEVESGFRQMKDPHVVSFSPMHHWTDSKIRVHVFYCVLALAVAHLMRRQAEHAGLHLSVRELLDELGGIQETVLLYHDGGKGRPRAQRMLTETTPTQKQLAELFDIHRYAPTR